MVGGPLLDTSPGPLAKRCADATYHMYSDCISPGQTGFPGHRPPPGRSRDRVSPAVPRRRGRGAEIVRRKRLQPAGRRRERTTGGLLYRRYTGPPQNRSRHRRAGSDLPQDPNRHRGNSLVCNGAVNRLRSVGACEFEREKLWIGWTEEPCAGNAAGTSRDVEQTVSVSRSTSALRQPVHQRASSTGPSVRFVSRSISARGSESRAEHMGQAVFSPSCGGCPSVRAKSISLRSWARNSPPVFSIMVREKESTVRRKFALIAAVIHAPLSTG